MQTFLPHKSFQKCADVLDSTRRWKQVVECFQILDVLALPFPYKGKKKPGWYNHPAVEMWRGYPHALMLYCNHMLCEVLRRKTHVVLAYQPFDMVALGARNPKMPPWFGGRIHRNHRARLLAKDREFYSQYGWKERPTKINFWPTR